MIARKLCAGGAVPAENVNWWSAPAGNGSPSEEAVVFAGMPLTSTAALLIGTVDGVSVNDLVLWLIVNATVPPVPLIVPESEWNSASLPLIWIVGAPSAGEAVIVFPAGSVKVTLIVTGVVPTEPKTPWIEPAVHACVPLSEIALALASKVIVNAFAVALTIDSVWICCERTWLAPVPVPVVSSYVVKVNVSLPGGTFSVTLHVHGPEPVHGAPGALPLALLTCVRTLNCGMIATPAVSAVMLTRTDFVAAEMYDGRRELELGVGAGILIVNVVATSPSGATAPGASPAGGSALPWWPPPHAASESAAKLASTEVKTFLPSRFMGTIPQPLSAERDVRGLGEIAAGRARAGTAASRRDPKVADRGGARAKPKPSGGASTGR